MEIYDNYPLPNCLVIDSIGTMFAKWYYFASFTEAVTRSVDGIGTMFAKWNYLASFTEPITMSVDDIGTMFAKWNYLASFTEPVTRSVYIVRIRLKDALF